jgi:hypothetical protein
MSDMDKARPALVTDMARLATGGLRANSREKTGMSGWVAYRVPNEARVPRNKAEIARRYCGVPFWI